MLEQLLPPGAGALLPNLQELHLRHCMLAPAARTTDLDAGCRRLDGVVVTGLSAQAPPPAAAGACTAAHPTNSSNLQLLATAQLRQLTKLPSLNSVILQDDSCPTLFLAALGTQLACLRLDKSYRQCEPGTQTPTPGWRATLQHVARCTRLRELYIPCASAGELGLVAPALQQLRTLTLNYFQPVQTDGDAMMDLLLGLPHLLHLQWVDASGHRLRRWYNDRPRQWEQLWFCAVSPEQLARLPLHSLTQPFVWQILMVQPGTSGREARAAVANVTQRCPAGFRWAESDQQPPQMILLKEADDAVLRACQPLFAALTGVTVASSTLDVERVKVLGEVLPRTCTRLMLSQSSVSREALEQVARSLPWVERMEFWEQRVTFEDVVAYVRLARRLGGEGGVARLQEVVVTRPACPRGMGEQGHRRAWERAAREVREEKGVDEMVLKVEW